jgi:hypothetical protein
MRANGKICRTLIPRLATAKRKSALPRRSSANLQASGAVTIPPFAPKSVTALPYANRHKNARLVPGILVAHDSEKGVPVFGSDHANIFR